MRVNLNLDYLKKYKGKEIIDDNGVVIVKSSDGSEFILDLDDSKSSGNRTSFDRVPNDKEAIKDAMVYIDWVDGFRKKRNK